MIPQRRDQVRSDEEWSFVRWLQEAVRHGLVDRWEYEPRTFILFPKQTFIEEVQMKTKSKQVERHLHADESYTPDFELHLTEAGRKLLYSAFKPSILASHGGACGEVWVDVKGAYNPNDQPRYFSSTRKAMYYIHNIWVAKVIPFHKSGKKVSGLFAETFAPEEYRWMKSRKEPTMTELGKRCLSAEEFMTKTRCTSSLDTL